MPVGRFIVGVAALIFHPATERYLLLKRAENKDVGAGSWECVAGRVDQGEGIEQALIREVREEIQVDVVPSFIVGTTHFYRGQAVPENELVGLLYACQLDDPHQVVISEEHAEARWMTWPEIRDFLPTDHWLRWLIQRAALIRAHLPEDLQDVYLSEGFEVGGRHSYS